MKKLMTVMASAATALFAIGAVNGDEAPLNATSFEQLTLNTQLNTLAGDDGQTTADKYYWYMASTDADNGTLVTNEVAGAGVSRPDYFAKMNQANTKALSLDTSSPLFRHVGTDTSGSLPAAGEAIGDGIYLDTLVKFTAADDVFGTDALATGDKIAISYVEQGDDVANPITNFVIRAGYIGENELTVTNYVAKLDGNAEFDKDVWHRLTVRTIPNIDGTDEGKGHVGFAVYVDQTLLVYANATDAAGDSFVADGVAGPLYTAEKKAIFPSAVDTDGDNATAITAASFSGTGAIDDVVFTKEMPGFLKETSEIPVTFTIPTGVSSVTVTYGAEPSVEVAVTPQNPTVNLPAGTEDFTLEVVADTENGYTYDGISGADIQNNVVTVSGVSMAITINVTRNNFIYIDAYDAQQSAVTLTDALAGVKAGGMIKLAYDYDVSAYEGIPEEGSVITINKNCVLDLNGNTLSATNAAEEAFISVSTGVSLTVIDSSNANTGTISYDANYSVFYAPGTGSCYIGAVEGDNGPTIVGAANSADSGVFIIRGKFDSAHNTNQAGDGFAWEIGVGDEIQCTAKSVGNYWVVEPNGGDEPEGYDNGGDGTFVIAAATETALKANLPVGKTLADKVSASSDLTYAQAYALGLWDAEAEEVAELEATISVGADGKVTVSLANAPADGYLVQCKVYEKASLAAEWPTEAKATYAYGSEQAFTPGSATAGFYKVAVVISNALQE